MKKNTDKKKVKEVKKSFIALSITGKITLQEDSLSEIKECLEEIEEAIMKLREFCSDLDIKASIPSLNIKS